MRSVEAAAITEVVARLCEEASFVLEESVHSAFQKAYAAEISPLGKDALAQILANAALAAENKLPICQDTGIMLVLVDLGQEVHVSGGSLYAAINQGVRDASRRSYLRKSIVNDPIERTNTKDNTPAVIHCRIVDGDRIKISLMPKSAGSENVSTVKVLNTADGWEGIKRFVLETVDQAGPNPCPPVIVGVGMGGTMEKAALLAKEALFRPVEQKHPLETIAYLESELLDAINGLGIGPMGRGGRTTALAVHVEVFPTHMSSLPVAVNLLCCAARYKTMEI
ncbi:fumarate hydratase [Candidatus Desulforudis audaxviator]|uniref:Hydro-lyase, Fe-S type, tartrate/fumarate subfamily, alpha subunit n=1 Tax=Desulforudis audaxviator (strain MP104C) TaxID=477974 RepID=B1I606_DESAP|nr:fumarate hydratase [Candidatus Desulforudis audaxviator]ACA60419.1 hydro-lyase, Fe-S type, tartrate/fumarate subfamily, alpha subunit [Candidatus Desulforudis audaxviator MP104C]AZK60475.1 hydro-lyase, Fe-S type, tartrate/fumarate subfamily, alpha subunit [Candidatus Desulforudis audaxviator]